LHGTSGRAGLACAVHEGEVYLFGGHNGEMPVKSAEMFRPGDEPDSRGEWVSLPPLLARRAYLSAVQLDGKIYAIGGSADGRTLSTFEVFDIATHQWDQWFAKPPMGTKRTIAASAVAEGRLYVTGGFDGIRDLPTVEVYDPRTNMWSSNTDNMMRGRSYHALATCAGSIYAIGGQERTSKQGQAVRAHISVEAFELYCERWLPVPDMSVGRIGPSAAVMKDENGDEFIYVTGGSDGDQVLCSGEVFDPRAGEWTPLPPMAIPRLAHGSAFVNGKLYVIGGFDGKVPMTTFECYDPATKRWSPPQEMGLIQPTPPAIAYHGAI